MLQLLILQIKFYFIFALTICSANVANDGNKLATPLESQTAILEEFILQSNEVAVTATVDILVIEFD